MTCDGGVPANQPLLSLPREYRALLAEPVRALKLARNEAAPCSGCPEATEGLRPPSFKCCNIVPRLPNFVLGGILEEGASPVVSRWIAEGRTDPFGSAIPPAEAERYGNSRLPGGRGALPCPFSDLAGGCTIYAHRNHICTAYHCRYPSPEHRVLWSALGSLLAVLDRAVSQALVSMVGLDPLAIARAWEEIDDESDVWDEQGRQKQEFYRAIWQSRFGDEEEFFLSCHRAVREQTPEVRAEAERIRRLQVLYGAEGAPPDRAAEIRREGDAPDLTSAGLEAPPSLIEAYRRCPVCVEDHPSTIRECEGHLLWLAARVSGV